MNKTPLNDFLINVDAIAGEKPPYQLGHDGSDGKCDCIGLIIGAIRRSGGSWDGIHGSNYAARNEMDYLLPVTDADDLNVGEVVYKASMPGQTNYNLPSRYAGDPDKRDYYHVGVVRSVDPLRIVHCTGPGIVTDTKPGKWTHRGWLARVSPNKGEETPMSEIKTAVITADSGSTVNLRSKPDGNLVDRIPVGAAVSVVAQQNGWVRIAYAGKSGWMMEKFVQAAGEAVTPAPSEDQVSITLPRSMAEQLRHALGSVLGWG